MAENTNIEWCDHTFNPFIGCTKVSPGCDNCYAEHLMDTRMHKVVWGPKGERVRTGEKYWRQPLKWERQAAAHQRAWESFKAEYPGMTDAELIAKGFTKPRRPRVFCASLADVFDNAVPTEWRADLFGLIMKTPHLDWLLLTKRIGNVKPMLAEMVHGSDPDLSLLDMMPLPNVWLGITVVNQEEADRDIPKLVYTPAAVRFLSMEPLLEAVDLRCIPHGEGEMNVLKPSTWEEAIDQWRDTDEDWVAQFEDWYSVNLSDGHTGLMHPRIDWVIAGGESGPGARPMHPDWVRSLRDQCEATGVPFLFKQWGEWGPTWAEAHWYLGPSMPMDPAGHHSIAGTRVITGVHADGRRHEGLWPIEKVGKKAAGRLLDGRTWDEFPKPLQHQMAL